MSEETKPEEVQAEVVEEGAPPPEEPKQKPPEWQYKTEFGINTRMREIIGKTIEVSELELKTLRHKLDRLTYGG